MKRSSGTSLPIRREANVDFLRVPEENVLDLRQQFTEEQEATPPPPRHRVHRMAGDLASKTGKFFFVALLVILPIVGVTVWQRFQSVEGKVLGASTEAYDALRAAGDALGKVDTALAGQEFSKAATSFREARETVDQFRIVVNSVTEVIPSISKAKSARAALAAGEELAQAGASLATVTEPLVTTGDQQTMDFPDLLTLAHANLPTTLDHVEKAVSHLKKVKAGDLPENLRPTFSRIQVLLPEITIGLKRFRMASDVIYELLGGRRTQRYLVLFQNNLELRASGGFIGSIALVDVADGHVAQLQIPTGGSYDFQGQLSEQRIAPEPLHLVNPHWQLQDANWWPDFPSSAKKIMWFYEKSGGPTVDGVLALTPDVLVGLLQETGPIDMTEKYGRTITSENVIRETLLAVEENPEQPKQIIADLVPRVLDRLLNSSSANKLAILSIFEAALAEKDLLLYFPDAERQAALVSLGWAGAYAPGERDTLSVVDTNIGGGKTDGVIDELIHHKATIADDGSIDVTVTVTRTHHGNASDTFTGMRNVDFIRFYVPQGSEFLAADGFERIDPKRFQAPGEGYATDPDIEKIEGRPVVDELTQTRISNEFGFTVFANWMGVGPGETTTASISYRLPFRLSIQKSLFHASSDQYSLLVIKQPGTNGRFFTSTISYPNSHRVRWQTARDGVLEAPGELRFSAALDTDQFFGIVLEPGS